MSLSLADRLDIDDLYTRFNVTVDSGADEQWVQTFTADGVFTASREVRGHDDLRDFRRERHALAAEQPHYGGQHWTTNLMLFPHSDDEVEAVSYLLRAGRHRDDESPVLMSVGRYHDVLARTPQGWRFASRSVIGPDDLPGPLREQLVES